MERLWHDGKLHTQNRVYPKNRTFLSVMTTSKASMLVTLPATTELFTHPGFSTLFLDIPTTTYSKPRENLRAISKNSMFTGWSSRLRVQLFFFILSSNKFYTYRPLIQPRSLRSDYLINNRATTSMSPSNSCYFQLYNNYNAGFSELRESRVAIIRHCYKLYTMSSSPAFFSSLLMISTVFYFLLMRWD